MEPLNHNNNSNNNRYDISDPMDWSYQKIYKWCLYKLQNHKDSNNINQELEFIENNKDVINGVILFTLQYHRVLPDIANNIETLKQFSYKWTDYKSKLNKQNGLEQINSSSNK